MTARNLNRLHYFDGAPFTGTKYGTTFQSLKGAVRRKETLESEDNILWTALHDGGLRAATARVFVFEKNIDAGNGKFFLERIARHPKYGRPIQIKRNLGLGYFAEYYGPVTLGPTIESIRSLILTGLSWPSKEAATLTAFALGGTAINATIPTKSHMSLVTSLAELKREGLPQLVGAQLVKRPNPLSLGGEYLNVQFGWAPIIRDFVSLLELVRDSGNLLREYHNLSQKRLRRQYTFPEKREVSTFTGTSAWPSNLDQDFVIGALGGTAVPSVHRVYTQRTWFSGAYQFALPYGDDFLSQIALWESEANHLLGTRITPETLWNLTAWSWLLDWFANIGDVVSNISHLGRDGLVLHYGYLMQSTRVSAQIHLPGMKPYGFPSDIQERVVLERKMRTQASPYGFGLNTSDFTPKQWAILAALGMSRADGALR